MLLGIYATYIYSGNYFLYIINSISGVFYLNLEFLDCIGIMEFVYFIEIQWTNTLYHGILQVFCRLCLEAIILAFKLCGTNDVNINSGVSYQVGQKKASNKWLLLNLSCFGLLTIFLVGEKYKHNTPLYICIFWEFFLGSI